MVLVCHCDEQELRRDPIAKSVITWLSQGQSAHAAEFDDRQRELQRNLEAILDMNVRDISKVRSPPYAGDVHRQDNPNPPLTFQGIGGLSSDRQRS